MFLMRRVVLRLRAVFLFGRLQREMDEEMRAHLEQAAERHVARGLTPAEAMVAARREFGNATVIASDARDARGARWSEALVTDVRLALRGLRRTPLFAVVAVLSIAIGVGATTAIVTIANALLLQSPPGVAHADRVITVGRTHQGRGFDTFSYPTYTDYAHATALAGLAAMDVEPRALSLVGPEGGEAVQGGVVSGNFFRVLEASPALGRFFGPSEDSTSNAAPVVVLSDRYWRKRFGADSSLVGRTIDLNGTSFTVVGIAAPGFQGPFVIAPDLWLPLHTSFVHTEAQFTSRRAVWLVGVGRLAPNRSLAQAQAELSTIAARLRQTYGKESDIEGVRVDALSLVPGDGRGVVAGFMSVLFVVAGLVLVVASTNVAGMLLARAADRQREIAVRIAMGASRSRLVRQLATESLVLGLAAGALGLALAKSLVDALMALVPRLEVPIVIHPTVDARVLAFAIGVAVLTGLMVGMLPALESTKPELVPALKIGAGATARRRRLRSALLVSQIAMSMLLLIAAGLFGRSLLRARTIDPGFATRGIDIVTLDLALAGYDSTRGVEQAAALVDRARRIPGVEQAALSAVLPLSGTAMGFGSIIVDGHPAPAGQDGWDADWNVVTPGYFAVLSIPLVRGRAFTAADRAGARDVAILNETFARRLFGSSDVVGRTLRNGDRIVTVVGVARDAKYRSLYEAPLNFIYVPLAQRYNARTNLLVRTAGSADVAAAARRVVRELDPRLPILDERTMAAETATSLFPQRLALWVTGSLAVIALLLALLGIYGVIAHRVAQRTREIGVRVALGAARGPILAMVLREGLVLAGTGVLLGAAAAFAATRLLASFLFGVPPTDAITFVGAAVLLVGAALAASWPPARRAARADPMIALRAE